MVVERNLNNEEIRSLKKDLKDLNSQILYHKRFLIIWCLVAIIIGTIAFFKLDSKALHYLLIGTVFVYILIGAWVFLEHFFKINKKRRNINFVLNKNTVLSINVISKKYVELSEEEDEGVFYLFELNNDNILSFGGQDFYPTKKFPSDDFEIIRAYGQSGELVLLEKHIKGNKIAPIEKITGEKKWHLLNSTNYPDPDSFTIINGNLNTIESIILKE